MKGISIYFQSIYLSINRYKNNYYSGYRYEKLTGLFCDNADGLTDISGIILPSNKCAWDISCL